MPPQRTRTPRPRKPATPLVGDPIEQLIPMSAGAPTDRKEYTEPMRMTLLNKVLIIVVVVLVVVVGGLVAWKQFAGDAPLYAVYLRTGDLYFGQLTRFPSFGLKHVYLLQVNQENTTNPLSIQRFADVFWGPEDKVTLNREDVVWYTKLRSDSELVNLIRTNPMLTAPQQPAGQTQGEPSAPLAPNSPGAQE